MKRLRKPIVMLALLLPLVSNAQDTVFIKKSYERIIVVKTQPANKRPVPNIFPKRIEKKYYDGDENKVVAKLLHIADGGIEFLQYGTEEPIYKMQAKDLDSVVFANGKVERFLNYQKKVAYIQARNKKYIDLDDNILIAGIGFMRFPSFVLLDFNSGKDIQPVLQSYISYERVFLHDLVGVSITPFIGLTRKAYGASLAMRYYLLHNKRGRISLGPVYQIIRQDIKESGSKTEIDYGNWVTKTYSTTLNTLGLDFNFQGHFNPRLFYHCELAVSGILSNSNRGKYIPATWDTKPKAQQMLRMGIGYRF